MNSRMQSTRRPTWTVNEFWLDPDTIIETSSLVLTSTVHTSCTREILTDPERVIVTRNPSGFSRTSVIPFYDSWRHFWDPEFFSFTIQNTRVILANTERNYWWFFKLSCEIVIYLCFKKSCNVRDSRKNNQSLSSLTRVISANREDLREPEFLTSCDSCESWTDRRDSNYWWSPKNSRHTWELWEDTRDLEFTFTCDSCKSSVGHRDDCESQWRVKQENEDKRTLWTCSRDTTSVKFQDWICRLRQVNSSDVRTISSLTQRMSGRRDIRTTHLTSQVSVVSQSKINFCRTSRDQSDRHNE